MRLSFPNGTHTREVEIERDGTVISWCRAPAGYLYSHAYVVRGRGHNLQVLYDQLPGELWPVIWAARDAMLKGETP